MQNAKKMKRCEETYHHTFALPRATTGPNVVPRYDSQMINYKDSIEK